jgi:glycosyltransferase involved in cell wall biosynthesis
VNTVQKRVLFISYQFPPVGGAGVQRVTKFVKYLQGYGWLPSVLTVANPSVPASDESLVADIPTCTIVRKARTWEPGYAVKKVISAGSGESNQLRGVMRRIAIGVVRGLANALLQPDTQVLWLPGAIRTGSRLLREASHAAIVATGPPFSTFLIGAALSRRTGLPLVLDYRDEWDLSNDYWENKRPNRLCRYFQACIQKQVVRQAGVLVATTRSSAETLNKIRIQAGCAARVAWIHNGFDPEDFAPDCRAHPQDKGLYRLVYVGTLWSLTSVAPLVEAVRDLARRQPGLAAGLELVFAGRRTDHQEQLLGRLKDLPCHLIEHSYIDHRAAINLIRSATGLCLLLADKPGADRVVPAKVFEYMAAKRPVLAIAPRGEAWDLLEDYPAAHRFVPADVEGISRWLAEQLRQHRAGTSPAFPEWDESRYNRRSQTGQLAEILESVTLAPRASGPSATSTWVL